jgi:predicted transposase YbfD/YdcC
MHMGSAWASANRMVWGQGQTDDQSNAITALPELLRVLALTGCLVTSDALGGQRASAATRVAQGADDLKDARDLCRSLDLMKKQCIVGSTQL